MSQVRVEKPEILRGLAPDQHVVIEASAGTGKTYTLERLVLDRVLAGVKISEILVVTFTEKAASEMRGRIRTLLADCLELCRGGGAAEGAPEEGACWVLDEEAEGYLDAALRTFDSAQISTIHAFCQRILGEQAFANQRLFSETTADARTLFSTAFLEALRSDFFHGEASLVFDLWLRNGTVEALEKLLYACASERARRMPACDTSAVEEILSLFPLDDDIPQVLEARWKELRSKQRHGPLVDRYHRVRELMEALPVADEEGAPVLRLPVAWAMQRGATSSTPWVRTIRERLEQIPDRCPRLEGLLTFCVRIEEEIPSLQALAVDTLLPLVARRLEATKRREGLLDFDDMLLALDRSLRGPGGAALTALLRGRFRCALIDEFQDTDEVQWSIFRRIFFDSGGANLLYAIGDPKQAIYQFRGADVQTYLEAKEAILADGGAHLVLEASFRSSPGLIRGINHILDPAGGFFTGEVQASRPVTPGRRERHAVGPDGAQIPAIEVLPVSGEEGRPPLVALGERIADEIIGLTCSERPTFLWDEGEGAGPRPLTHSDVYVLYRTTREGRILSQILRRRGVPFAFYKEEGLFQREEAWAWHDVLQAVASPDDPLLRTRAWLSPFFCVSLEEVGALRDLAEDHPFLVRLHGWAALAEERRYEALFSSVLDESGVLRRAIATDDERQLTNLLHLSELLLERANQRRCSLAELIQWLRAVIDERELPGKEGGNQQRLETERQAVQLMTLHASKGLEAPVVFLAGGIRKAPGGSDLSLYHEGRERRVWIGKPPAHVAELVQVEERQESERLLYVGMTRAMGRLYLPLYGVTVNGTYAPLQERLEAIQGEAAAGAAEGSPLREFHFGDGQVPLPQQQARVQPAVPEAPGQDAGWDEAVYDDLRQQRLGFVTTSYTRMRGFRAAGEWEEERVEGEQEVAPPGPDELPGGAASGIFLHEILARLDPAQVPAGFEDFRAEQGAQAIFGEEARRHGIHGPHLEHAWQLVHRALVTPIPLAAGEVLEGGVKDAARWLPEMEFLYPLPEEGHPPLDAAPGPLGFEIGKGFVKGFIDLIFQQGERVYFADWKSDSLPSFDGSYVDRYVDRSYEIQARLYTLAVVKLLGWRDEASYERGFGGLYYFFLRGMAPDSTRGIYQRRPTWAEVLSWERWLRGGNPP